METLTTYLPVLVVLLVRLAIPIGFTILVVYALRHLDEYWKRQAKSTTLQVVQARNIGCWEINNCSPQKMAGCKAFANPDMPCWQVYRQPDGHMQERCLVCQVFRRSPVPLPSRA
jgi:hypothetical protein